MRRIDTNDERFHDGAPFNGIQGTIVTAAWLNSIQEEIATVIEAAGLELNGTDQEQLLSALVEIFSIAITQPAGDNSAHVATDAFVQTAIGGLASVNVAGNSDKTLTSAQWGCGIIVMTGGLTGNINVIVPARSDQWLIANRTSGNYKITFKTLDGTGVLLPQSQNVQVFCDGTDMAFSVSDQTDDAFSFFIGNL